MSDDQPVKVIPFLNPFVEEPRIEVVVDWDEAWPAVDPFADARFKLAVTSDGVTDPPDDDAFGIDLTPILIPEVHEQLVVVGLSKDGEQGRPGDVAGLAPSFVSHVAGEITGHFVTPSAARGARSMEEFVGARTQLFAATNLLGDCARWIESRSLDNPVEVKEIQRARDNVGPAVEALMSVLGLGDKNAAKQVESRQGLRDLLDLATKRAEPEARRRLVELEAALRLVSIEEQLIYAEALRRDLAYSRLRSQRKVDRASTMAGATTEGDKLRDRRADVRRMARDEPVMGAMFHVLRWFSMPAEAGRWDDQLVWVRPFSAANQPVPGYCPVATRAQLVHLSALPVTVLRRDRKPSYFARAVTARQIAPALLIDGEDADEMGVPRDIGLRLSKMFEFGQNCPPIAHHMIEGGDPAERLLGREPEKRPHVAFVLNDRAYRPGTDEEGADDSNKEREYVYSDAIRELEDAAESLRRTAPPYDVIGISWDRDLTARAILDATARRVQPQGEPCQLAVHFGFKGYRIDVRESGQEAWQSLCTVEREMFDHRQQAVMRSRLPRESYVVQPVQNHSHNKKDQPTVLTLPADFVHWAGGSVVAAAPLDRLGEALAPPATNGSLLVVREIGTTGVNPRYGHKYQFRVRSVGLSGVGPGAAATDVDVATDEVDFRRGVPIDAPVVYPPEYVDLVPLDTDRQPTAKSEGTPDAPLLATSAEARLVLETSPPLAHWRVALHARDLTREERAVLGGPAFERACARFVTRNRENWRRRLAGVSEPRALKPAAHLSALDPHCGAVEVVSRAWFPFSSNGPDRYIVTGRAVQTREDICRASFSELVTRGEDQIETEVPDGGFEARVSRATLPACATPESPPRILAGFHGTVEVSALWSKDALLHYQNPDDGRKRWTRNLFVGVREARPIGGKIKPLDLRLTAGEPAQHTDTVFADASYAGLANPENERELRLPPPPERPEKEPEPRLPPPSENPPSRECEVSKECEISSAPPALASPAYWRKRFFDEACRDYPFTPDFRDRRVTYSRFVAQQLGFPGELVDFPSPEAAPDGAPKNPYENKLAVRLGSRLIERTVDEKLWHRALVVPAFTFPVTTTYGPAEPLKQRPQVRSVAATLGELGSPGITRIVIKSEERGTGYVQADLSKIKVEVAANGQKLDIVKARVSQIEDGGIQAIEVIDGGHDLPAKPPAVTIKEGSGSGAVASAELGLLQRRLPWVDADIVWTVRLAWRVPLAGSEIERPLELAAVKEFALYRRDVRAPACDDDPACPPCPPCPEENRPLATLARPGVDTLQQVDLDLVEFTWVDAISDREPHEYEYTVVAVPEDGHTFSRQEWFKFRVDVPDTRIAPRPESMRFLPMLATRGKAGVNRHLGLFFSDSVVRQRADRVTVRFAKAADDPMLPIAPTVAVEPQPARYLPTKWEELFPRQRSPVQVVRNWAEVKRFRNRSEGEESLLISDWKAAPWSGEQEEMNVGVGGECPQPDSERSPATETPRSRADSSQANFFVVSSSMGGRRLIWSTESENGGSDTHSRLGNPFFKLHLFIYDGCRLPALAHTVASEPAESDWLQFYPDDLIWAAGDNRIAIEAPWGKPGASPDNLVWYRFHFFADATSEFLFHLSSFYSHEPQLELDDARREAISKAYEHFAGERPRRIHLYVRAEEGLLAPTYELEKGDEPRVREPTSANPAPARDIASFVVLRSTQVLKDVWLEECESRSESAEGGAGAVFNPRNEG